MAGVTVANITQKTCCYLILAKGYSRRIPRKNLQEIEHIPLLLWPFKEAHELDLPVFVSTDSDEIGDIARLNGAEVLSRPAELCEDHIRWEPVEYHVKRGELNYDLIGLRQATCPFLQAETARKCFEVSARENAIVATAYHELHEITLRKTGALYSIPRDMIISGAYQLEENWLLQPTSWVESIDIDEPEQLELARQAAKDHAWV